MTHSLLCYVIRALNNHQPNGCVKGKCGWTQSPKPVRGQLWCANTSIKPFPLLVFAYKESRCKVAFDCYVCLSKNQEPIRLLHNVTESTVLGAL